MPSSVIRRFAYHADSRSLDIEFVSGRRYRYREVPSDVAAAFRAAFAKGRFFNAHVRRLACDELEEGIPSALDAAEALR